jgi:AbrB family looped-hinge helix DNA binding protein
MEKILGMKSATITSKGQVTIPKELREQAGFKTGSKVIFLAMEQGMQVIPLEKMSEGMEAYLLSSKSLAKIWDAPEEDEAWKHL